jgi:hypothetical protein
MVTVMWIWIALTAHIFIMAIGIWLLVKFARLRIADVEAYRAFCAQRGMPVRTDQFIPIGFSRLDIR